MKKKSFDGPLQSHLLSYKIDMPDHWPPPLSNWFSEDLKNIKVAQFNDDFDICISHM